MNCRGVEADVQTIERGQTASPARSLKRVVVVDGNQDVLNLLEVALEGGQYELMFAEAGHHAYSLVRREQPDLVVLSMRIDTMEGFQLLSMLKLDPDTKGIPVVTYASDVDADNEDDSDDEDEARYSALPPLRLH